MSALSSRSACSSVIRRTLSGLGTSLFRGMVLIMDGLRMRAGADRPHPLLTRHPAPSPLTFDSHWKTRTGPSYDRLIDSGPTAAWTFTAVTPLLTTERGDIFIGDKESAFDPVDIGKVWSRGDRCARIRRKNRNRSQPGWLPSIGIPASQRVLCNSRRGRFSGENGSPVPQSEGEVSWAR